MTTTTKELAVGRRRDTLRRLHAVRPPTSSEEGVAVAHIVHHMRILQVGGAWSSSAERHLLLGGRGL